MSADLSTLSARKPKNNETLRDGFERLYQDEDMTWGEATWNAPAFVDT